MKVYGPRSYPTVRWLSATLEPVDFPRDLAWKCRHEGAILGHTKYLGLSQLQKLGEAEELEAYIPNYSLDPRRGYVGRVNDHYQGKNIYFPDHADYYTAPEYYVEWVNNIVAEWRVWVVGKQYFETGARTFTVAKKVYVGNDTPITNIRSRQNGWHLDFTHRATRGLRPTARNAVDALNYDFGAVDILELPNKQFVVLEVNSAFAIKSPHTKRRFLNSLLLKNVNPTANTPSPFVEKFGTTVGEHIEHWINQPAPRRAVRTRRVRG